MPLTVRDLLADPGLGLTLLTPGAPVDAPVLWAHTSELPDPTPWLAGGELIMTLGLGLPETEDEQAAYVQRLAGRGVVALGVDTGIVLDDVPAGVVAAGVAHDLPILRIPPPTPFMAISRAVVSALVQDDVDAVRRVAAQQERVAAAALRAGSRGIVDSLSAILKADVALIGLDGQLREARGFDLGRLRSRVLERLGSSGGIRPVAGLVHLYPDGVLTVQSLVGEGRDPLLVALGSREAFTVHQRLVVTHAVTLLSLLSRTPERIAGVEDQLRQAVGRLLFVEGGRCDSSVLRALGFPPGEPVLVVFAAGTDDIVARAALDDVVAAVGGPHLRTRLADGEVVALLGAEHTQRVGHAAHPDAHLGMGVAPSLAEGLTALHEARSAARIARFQGRAVVSYADLAPTDALLLAQPEDARHALVRRVLGGLLDNDSRHGTTLVDTVEAFLANNGVAESTAQALGVHRHTLRQRLAKVEKVLGVDLSSAVTRSDLWLALRAQALLQRAEEPRTVPEMRA